MSTCGRCGFWLGDQDDSELCAECAVKGSQEIKKNLDAKHVSSKKETPEDRRIDRIFLRYSRKSGNKPVIYHHGDCYIYKCDICTCGLLHDLAPLSSVDLILGIYSNYEEDVDNQERAIDKLGGNHHGNAQSA